MLGSRATPGLMVLTLRHLYQTIERTSKEKSRSYKVSLSYVEVYNENIRDLLSNSDEYLDLREDPIKGNCVAGVSEHVVTNTDDILELLTAGNKRRSQEPTAANRESSRSHAVLQIHVQGRETAVNGRGRGAAASLRAGKLCLIDLAGSERAANTKNSGIRLLEGANINRSLLALGNCITALVQGKGSFVPYRDSKLTRLLKDSLGGNCKTVMISCISPAGASFEETCNTLKYANRAKNIKTQVVRNEETKVAVHISEYEHLISGLRSEVATLKSKLAATGATVGIRDGLGMLPSSYAGGMAMAAATAAGGGGAALSPGAVLRRTSMVAAAAGLSAAALSSPALRRTGIGRAISPIRSPHGGNGGNAGPGSGASGGSPGLFPSLDGAADRSPSSGLPGHSSSPDRRDAHGMVLPEPIIGIDGVVDPASYPVPEGFILINAAEAAAAAEKLRVLREALVTNFQERMQLRRSLIELQAQNVVNQAEVGKRQMDIARWESEAASSSSSSAAGDALSPLLSPGGGKGPQGQAAAAAAAARKEVQELQHSVAANNKIKAQLLSRLEDATQESDGIRAALDEQCNSDERRELLSLEYRVCLLELEKVELEQSGLLAQRRLQAQEVEVRKLRLALKARDRLLKAQAAALASAGLASPLVAAIRQHASGLAAIDAEILGANNSSMMSDADVDTSSNNALFGGGGGLLDNINSSHIGDGVDDDGDGNEDSMGSGFHVATSSVAAAAAASGSTPAKRQQHQQSGVSAPSSYPMTDVASSALADLPHGVREYALAADAEVAAALQGDSSPSHRGHRGSAASSIGAGRDTGKSPGATKSSASKHGSSSKHSAGEGGSPRMGLASLFGFGKGSRQQQHAVDSDAKQHDDGDDGHDNATASGSPSGRGRSAAPGSGDRSQQEAQQHHHHRRHENHSNNGKFGSTLLEGGNEWMGSRPATIAAAAAAVEGDYSSTPQKGQQRQSRLVDGKQQDTVMDRSPRPGPGQASPAAPPPAPPSSSQHPGSVVGAASTSSASMAQADHLGQYLHSQSASPNTTTMQSPTKAGSWLERAAELVKKGFKKRDNSKGPTPREPSVPRPAAPINEPPALAPLQPSGSGYSSDAGVNAVSTSDVTIASVQAGVLGAPRGRSLGPVRENSFSGYHAGSRSNSRNNSYVYATGGAAGAGGGNYNAGDVSMGSAVNSSMTSIGSAGPAAAAAGGGIGGGSVSTARAEGLRALSSVSRSSSMGRDQHHVMGAAIAPLPPASSSSLPHLPLPAPSSSSSSSLAPIDNSKVPRRLSANATSYNNIVAAAQQQQQAVDGGRGSSGDDLTSARSPSSGAGVSPVGAQAYGAGSSRPPTGQHAAHHQHSSNSVPATTSTGGGMQKKHSASNVGGAGSGHPPPGRPPMAGAGSAGTAFANVGSASFDPISTMEIHAALGNNNSNHGSNVVQPLSAWQRGAVGGGIASRGIRGDSGATPSNSSRMAADSRESKDSKEDDDAGGTDPVVAAYGSAAAGGRGTATSAAAASAAGTKASGRRPGGGGAVWQSNITNSKVVVKGVERALAAAAAAAAVGEEVSSYGGIAYGGNSSSSGANAQPPSGGAAPHYSAARAATDLSHAISAYSIGPVINNNAGKGKQKKHTAASRENQAASSSSGPVKDAASILAAAADLDEHGMCPAEGIPGPGGGKQPHVVARGGLVGGARVIRNPDERPL